MNSRTGWNWSFPDCYDRGRRAGALLLLLIALSACQNAEITTKSAAQRSVLTVHLTDNAARLVSADGTFPLAHVTGPDPELTQRQAEELALVWSNKYAPGERRLLEQDHGATIVFGQLTICGRTLYAESSFELDPSFDPAFKRGIGPFWLVTVCDGGQTALSVAVSALATNVTVSRGMLAWSMDGPGGNEFIGFGIPAGTPTAIGNSPEDAVVAAGTALGTRIADAPRLISPSPLRGPPQAAVWQMPLEAAVRVGTHAPGAADSTAVAYDGILQFHLSTGPHSNKSSLLIPSQDQPLTQTIRFALAPNGQYVVRRKAGVAVVFQTLSLNGAAQ